MSIGLGDTTVYRENSADLNDTNGTILFTVPVTKPVDVLRFGVVNNHATAIPTALVLTLKYRPIAGTDTDEVDIATLSPEATVARGDGVYANVVADASPSAGDRPGRVEANAGGELAIALTTQAGAAQTGHLFIEGVERPFQHTSADPDEDRLAGMTEV